jgi:hypothetical protein
VRAADLNGDGSRDVVVADEEGRGVWLFSGRGNGTLEEPVLLPVGLVPQALLVEDLNGDGAKDLAVADYLSFDGSTSAGELWVLLADGTGGFGLPTRNQVGDTPVDVQVADLNDDTHPDLMTVNLVSDDVSVLMNDGDGGFLDQQRVVAGLAPIMAVPVDLDGDEAIDLAVVASSSQGIPLLLGDSDGALGRAIRLELPRSTGNIVMGDFNHDGLADLAGSSGLHVATEGTDSLFVLEGDGNARFSSPLRTAVGLSPSRIVAADFNRDGIDDIAVLNGQDVSVLSGNDGGALGPESRLPLGPWPYDMASGDLDGNGHADLAIIHNREGESILVWLSGPAGWTAAPALSPPGRGVSIAIGDYSHDGLPDIVAAMQAEGFTGNLVVFPGLGAGDFGHPVIRPLEHRPHLVRAARLAGNEAHSDLILVPENWDYFDVFHDFRLRGRLSAHRQRLSSPDGVWDVTVADLDGDHLADVIAALGSTALLAVYRGQPCGQLGAAEHYLAGTASGTLAVGDVNRDGVPDVAMGNASDKQVLLLLGQPDLSPRSPNRRVKCPKDYDGTPRR